MKLNVGNWTVVPSVKFWELFVTFCAWLVGSAATVPESDEVRPVNVNVSTSPIELKNGTNVSRTKRRSGETTACTLNDVPSLSTTTTVLPIMSGISCPPCKSALATR